MDAMTENAAWCREADEAAEKACPSCSDGGNQKKKRGLQSLTATVLIESLFQQENNVLVDTNVIVNTPGGPYTVTGVRYDGHRFVLTTFPQTNR